MLGRSVSGPDHTFRGQAYLKWFKSSTQFTSFHQYSDMLSSERMDVENNS